MQLGLSAKLLLKQLGKKLRILQLEGQQHTPGCQATAEVVLFQQAADSLLRIIRQGENLKILVQQIAAGIMQHRKASLGFSLPVANNIGIRKSAGRYQLLLPQGLHRIQPVTQAGRKLKFQIFGSREHLFLDLIRYRFIVSLQQLASLLHNSSVLQLRLACLAPAGTLIHVIIQTGSLFPHIPGKDPVAIRQLQRQTNGFHDTLGHASGAVGAIILGAVIRDLAYHADPGICFLHIQPQIGIALVILQ